VAFLETMRAHGANSPSLFTMIPVKSANTLRVATWNVNSIRMRLDTVLHWMDSSDCDLLALQETKVQDHEFPIHEFASAGYHILFNGQKSYNGVAILSKQPGVDPRHCFPNDPDPQKRILAATYNKLRIINVYVPMGQSLESDKYTYKLKWYQNLHELITLEQQRHEQLIVLGDFNVAPRDQDTYNPKLWQNRVLVSDLERQALNACLQLGLHDSYQLFPQHNEQFSWWDYRGGAFQRNHGLRIDHLLISNALKDTCLCSDIDKTPRGLNQPSDHAPAYADFKI
jgi:exodeoxyribonuclease III